MARMRRTAARKQEHLGAIAGDVNKELELLRSKMAELEQLKDLVKALKGEIDGLEETVMPRIMEAQDQMIRIGEQAARLKETTRTTVSWKKMYEVLHTKVNPATQQMMEKLKEDLSNVRTYRHVQFKRLQKQGALQRAWDAVSGTVGGWFDKLIGTLTSGADEIERIVDQAMGKRIDKRVEEILRG